VSARGDKGRDGLAGGGAGCDDVIDEDDWIGRWCKSTDQGERRLGARGPLECREVLGPRFTSDIAQQWLKVHVRKRSARVPTDEADVIKAASSSICSSGR
jgi:hypothetical protein